MIGEERWTRFEAYRAHVEAELERVGRATLAPTRIDPGVFASAGLEPPERPTPLRQYLARVEMSAPAARAAGLLLEDGALEPLELARAQAQVLLQCKYEGYIRKQAEQVEHMRRMEDKPLPEWLDYAGVHGLRREAREKLARLRPATVGQAGRVAGINQTDLTLVLVHLKSRPAA
jgi:tRNA uridine 5-carboxymethylaminomethyl modification enzyme